jgi:predicted DNA-binding transcriptional regulator YafY
MRDTTATKPCAARVAARANGRDTQSIKEKDMNKIAVFHYVKPDGSRTSRVVAVTNQEPEYFRGVDIERRAWRTFRRDRCENINYNASVESELLDAILKKS